MDVERQTAAVDSLREWSKWSIGLGFLSATGCVLVLQGDVPPLAQIFLVLAISTFAASVLCSILLLRVLATLVERLPVLDAQGSFRSIYQQRLLPGLTVARIAAAQLLFLMLGGASFLAWIVAPLF